MVRPSQGPARSRWREVLEERAQAGGRHRLRGGVLRDGWPLPHLRPQEAEGGRREAPRGGSGMSEAALPGQTKKTGVGDAAVVRGRQDEDVVVGGEIVRHRLCSRVIHWAVALFFFVALFSGLPIWTPLFGWMATLFGGLHVCRWLHPWSGLALAVASVVMFVPWLSATRLGEAERERLSPRDG